jgi:hypothetical protein
VKTKFRTNIVKRYLTGESSYKISKDEGCSYNAVLRELKRKGVNTGLSFWNQQEIDKLRHFCGRHWESLVSYNLNDLVKHLEKQFDDKMNWENYGSYWHIDHIKPKSLFKYVYPEDEDFKKCWSLENLQPLEKIANMRKKNNFIG